MTSILDVVKQHLGPAEIAQIGQQLGTDPAATQQAIDAALPGLVGGMANTAQDPQGAATIHGLMGSHGGILGDLGAAITGGGAGGGILGSILGQHQPAVEQGVQDASGLQADKAKKLLMILAPIVLSALARRTMGADGAAGTGGGGLGGILNGGLGDILRQDATQAQQQTQGSPMGGILGKILGGLT